MSTGARGRRYIPGVPFGLGIWEIVILVGVLVLLFGSQGRAGDGAPPRQRREGDEGRGRPRCIPRSLLDPKDEPAKPAAAHDRARSRRPRCGSSAPLRSHAPEAAPPSREPSEPPAS